MPDRRLKVLIAGGGTGGHLFPALAIGDELKKRVPGISIHYVGSRFGVESRQFPKRTEPFTLLNIRGFVRGLSLRGFLRNLIFPPRFVWAYMRCRRVVSRFDPDVVVGTGGYASGLPLLAAIHKGIPTAIHEQNSYPGFTTRWLSRKVDMVFLSYRESRQYLKKKNSYSRGIP
ncbi:MAG: glycosyltransferase [Fidelibacterota bacterium]